MPSILEEIWSTAANKVKDRIVLPSFWLALEAAVPIEMEEDRFILGMAPEHSSLAGHFRNSAHQHAIEEEISAVTGRRMNMVLIEGTTRQDWDRAKMREQALKRVQDAQYTRSQRIAEVERSWEGLYDQVQRMYVEMPLRNLPQVRALYLRRALEQTIKVVDTISPPGEPMDEQNSRNLGRIIDRIAANIEASPSLVAYEMLRLRQGK